jgi:HD-GYP domain-containing protein (c-di-GMP phosphodiesterase class II)
MDMLKSSKLRSFFKVDKELVIIFLLVAMTGFIFFFVVNQIAFLNFFYLPVILGAYFFGKRYATLAALFSIILISALAYTYPATFNYSRDGGLYRWLDLLTWGSFLLVTGYAMGHLYEKKEEATREIKSTYLGVIEMLSLVIDSVDTQTQSHSYRVSVIAEQIAQKMGLPTGELENIRIAALLHDLGKIGVSCEILGKIGKLSTTDLEQIKGHTQHAVDVLEPLGGKVNALLPIILNHHEKFDGTGYNAQTGVEIPLGARIVAVADVYDALISDRPYRKALSPFQAKKEIMENSGNHFDPAVVKVFDSIFPKLDVETLSYTRSLKI